MNSLWLVITALAAFAVAYRFYGAFLATRVAVLNDNNPTPAHRLRDGVDYHPTKQIVLFGQPELDDKLNEQSIRQLRQRITFDYHLKPLTREDMSYYLAHRLHIAGYPGGTLFSPYALRWLYKASGGIPRLANIVAHKSLMAAYGEGKQQVEGRHVKVAVNDTPAVKSRSRPLWPF